MASMPQIAADLTHRPTRQSWAKSELSRARGLGRPSPSEPVPSLDSQSVGDGYAEKLGIAFIAVRRPRASALGIYPLSGG
jgi:hypothetical protein